MTDETARKLETAAPNPFDPEKYKLSQDFLNSGGAKKVLKVPVRRTNPQEFFRVHPQHRLTPTAIVYMQEDRQHFLVTENMLAELADELAPMCLYLAITRQQNPFLWPVRIRGMDGRYLDWHRSAHEAAELAMEHWIKIRANMEAGMYDTFIATAEGIPEPRWPEESFEQILATAFPADRIINSPDHPVVRKLRGEV
jgi:hypothetical protein